jgi:hypothetical protein
MAAERSRGERHPFWRLNAKLFKNRGEKGKTDWISENIRKRQSEKSFANEQILANRKWNLLKKFRNPDNSCQGFLVSWHCSCKNNNILRKEVLLNGM